MKPRRSRALSPTQLAAPKHTVVLSDIHLWQAVEPAGLWMRYRQRDLFPDEELRDLLAQLRASVRPGDLEVVFAGDIFDFDVPFVRDGVSDPRTSCVDESSAVVFMDAIIDDHPIFLSSVCELLEEGHSVTFLCGNHDLQLALEGVRQVLRERLVQDSASRHGVVDPDALLSRLSFRSWFHCTATGVLVEHGSQYDRYCSVLYPMQPVLEGSQTLAPTMGSLAMRELIAKLGYFNPNVDSSFLLTARGYLQHWVRYYLFRKHSLVRTWLFGSIRVAFGIFTSTERPSDARARRESELAMQETGRDEASVQKHRSLFVLPDLGRIARLLGIDAVGAGVGLILAGALAVALEEPLLGAGLGLLTVLCAVLFRVRVGDCSLDQGYAGVRQAMHSIAAVHGARAVVFGHTHLPGGEWAEDGVFYGNSGTWSPTFADVACTLPLHQGRPFIWLWDDGQLRGGEFRFDGGRIEPVTVEALPAQTRSRSVPPAQVA